MNRVSKRAWALVVLIAILLGGLGFFLGEFFMNASVWVGHTNSPHLFGNSGTAAGSVVDRNGEMLLTIGGASSYAESAAVREAMLHWLGDREGKINAPMVAYYAAEMSDYDLLNGLYSYSDVPGCIELTLSADVQAAALKAMGDHQGVIAVYNYETGEILCAVTTPTYDPDDPPDLSQEELENNEAYDGLYWNRVTRSVYTPGSIFKIVTTAAALETIDDIQQQTFECTGAVAYGPDTVTCENAHGTVDLKKAMRKSCNCAYAQIADQLGADTLMRYVGKFGITTSLKFDGITTKAGSFDLSGAADVEVAWAAIGQYTDQINPLQYMTLMGAIAGGGSGAEPHMVSRVARGEDPVYEVRSTSTGRLVSAETAQILTELMRNNVENNYGSSNFPGLTVCAKSGTSQVGGDQVSNALFSGFVADEEYPLAFIVVVENGGYGSSTCVPIMSEVLAACKDEMDKN
ncbi:MAG: penicillin-binding protein [Oscillospiraceae bacterium]|nr:penicillin-binding protein [Oscillospiraceae bacterium]